MHSLGIIHRDLKLDNILLTGTGACRDIKIADFGLSALVRIGEQGYDPSDSCKRKGYKALSDMWGTKEMFAPELIDQAYGPQADMWSVGCILYEMLSGHQAFPIRDHDTESSFYSRIKRGDYDMSRSVWRRVSADGKDLLHYMLKVDPEKRISGKNTFMTLYSRIFHTNTLNLLATEALRHRWITSVEINERENSRNNSSVSVNERVNAKVLRKQESKPKQRPPDHS